MPEKKRCQMERKENKVRFCALSEVLADWKWLLTYSRRCKKMIALYIALQKQFVESIEKTGITGE